MYPTKNWWKMGELYRFFAKQWDVDFSNEAAADMFRYESYGGDPPPASNGYALGKKWMDVTVAMWREDIEAGLLYRFELLETFPDWFVERVTSGVQQGRLT